MLNPLFVLLMWMFMVQVSMVYMLCICDMHSFSPLYVFVVDEDIDNDTLPVNVTAL